MKARIPMSNKARKSLEQEARLVCAKEIEKQQKDFTRKIFKIICRVLNEQHGFGKKRCLTLIGYITALLESSHTDEVFWEHLDRYVIDYMGIPFERDYSD